jgi:uncharacterized protein
MGLRASIGLTVAAALLAVVASQTRLAADELDEWRAATQAWRAKQEQALRAPDGWLTVAGLFFLKPGVNRVGADPTSDVVRRAPATRTPPALCRWRRTSSGSRFRPAKSAISRPAARTPHLSAVALAKTDRSTDHR